MSGFIGQQPLTDEDRKKSPNGEQPIPMGIESGYGALNDAANFVKARIKKFGEPVDVVAAVAVAMADERKKRHNSVMVELIDGKPVVSIMVQDEAQKPALEALARNILRYISAPE